MITPQTEHDLRNRFTYHKPFGDQPQRYELLRKHAFSFALAIADLCPDSREKSLALTKIEEAVMWANSSIARNDKPVEKPNEPAQQ